MKNAKQIVGLEFIAINNRIFANFKELLQEICYRFLCSSHCHYFLNCLNIIRLYFHITEDTARPDRILL